MLDKKADLADMARHGHDVRDVVGLVETFAVVNERLIALTGLAESQQHVLQHHTHAPLEHTHTIEDIPQYVFCHSICKSARLFSKPLDLLIMHTGCWMC